MIVIFPLLQGWCLPQRVVGLPCHGCTTKRCGRREKKPMECEDSQKTLHKKDEIESSTVHCWALLKHGFSMEVQQLPFKKKHEQLI